MKSPAALVLAIALSSSCLAQNTKVAPRYTGAMVLEHWLIPPGATDRDARGEANFRIVSGYLHGVHDATEGTAWCYAGRIKPDELDAYVVWELKKLPPDVLKGNAAPLLVETLRKKYPCH